jgi:Tfp pilus assembly protein PilN
MDTDKILQAIVVNSGPGSVVMALVFVLVYVRKQETGVRVELNTSLQRLQLEKEKLQAMIDRLEAEAQAREDEIDRMRQLRRTIEDTADAERRRADAEKARADAAEQRLKNEPPFFER